MLLPLTIAATIVAFACFTIYAFRLVIARWLGLMHRQVQVDKQEIKESFNDGVKRRD